MATKQTNMQRVSSALFLSVPPGVWHHSPSSTQEANWKHGPRVHRREAERTADLSGLNYPASLAIQLLVCQEVSGPQQLLCQLHR